VGFYSNIKTLTYAYELIKSNPDNMTKGVSPETLDGMDLAWLERIQKQLQNGTYRFQRIRRVKKDGSTRPIGVTSPRDKVVQRALTLALSLLYESQFHKEQHGNKGCHSALNQVRMTFADCTWVLQTHIRKCFYTAGSIDHQVLLELISRRVSCPITLSLIESALTAGYLDELGNTSECGTPQGSSLSPLLFDILLHEMDSFILGWIEQYNKGKERRIDPVYIRSLAKLVPDTPEWVKAPLALRGMSSMDPLFRRMHYVRYADDFIVGFQGHKHEVRAFLDALTRWLEHTLKLTLHPDKTHIRHLATEGFDFLGIRIGPSNSKDRPVRRYAHGRKHRVTPRLPMTVDLMALFKRLKERGFVRFNQANNVYVGIPYSRLHNLHIEDIIRYFNDVFRGIWGYYSFVDNSSSLNHVWWALQQSLAFTISRKLRGTGIKHIFKRFGFPIKGPNHMVSWRPSTFARDPLRLLEPAKKGLLSLLRTSWATKLTRSYLGRACIICGATDKVEMHHLRKIKDLRKRLKLMAAINRKQVPLCREHHIGLHRGALNERDRELFTQGCRDLVDSQSPTKCKPQNAVTTPHLAASRMTRKCHVRF
jgi:group II intron reverse transcriptase/maturase